MKFEIASRVDAARLGRLSTPHGVVETPAFMPVGTLGAVKGIGPHELEASGATVMLANLYHLAISPGIETVEELGGLHRFSGWRGPLLTDSGGYQVFSLAQLRRVDEEGVTFRSHRDGRAMRLTPESVVEMQLRLGVDLAMVLDECPPWPVSREAAAASLDRTTRWARRARDCWPSDRQAALFGIVQGSFYDDLREQAVEALEPLDFDGYAIGGVSVGEERQLGRPVVRRVAGALPPAKPRYLMGLGKPSDLLFAVRSGVDLFDCVLPSRNARHGLVFTRAGMLRIKNARFGRDPRPLDEGCGCTTCQRTSRAFLHHLFRCGEITGKVLATIHNLRFYLDFMADLRQALKSETLAEMAAVVTRIEGEGSALERS